MATALDTQLADILSKTGLGAAIAALAKGEAGDEVEAVAGEEGKGDQPVADESGGDNQEAVAEAAAAGEATGAVEDLAKGDDDGDDDKSEEEEEDDDSSEETSESEETDPTSSEEEEKPNAGFEAMRLGGQGNELDVTEFVKGVDTIVRQSAATLLEVHATMRLLGKRIERLEKATKVGSDELAALRADTSKISPQIERLSKGTAAAFRGVAATVMAAGTHAASRVNVQPALGGAAQPAGFTSQQLMKGIANGALTFAESQRYEATRKTHAQGTFSDDDARNREIIANLTQG